MKTWQAAFIVFSVGGLNYWLTSERGYFLGAGVAWLCLCLVPARP